ncbi:MAG: ABC transporter ATP-binding protein [Bacteroidetes bacterium]|nr:ABC transporter ATP-binding protein [Bacteroidota bacterium]
MLELRDIRRDFVVGVETIHALQGVSFSIEPGEFVTIMGSSGSGKTTLLNILGCLDRPTSGAYLLDGIETSDLSRNELARIRNRKIGFVFQTYNLLPRTTAVENVELPLLYNREINTKQRRERAIHALGLVGLQDRLDHTPAQLSGGQQQRVAIARAMINQPVMILADEATGNLDSRTSYSIMELFQQLNQEEKKTIVFVTHEQDIAAFSGRTILLRDGQLLKDSINKDIRQARAALSALPVPE